MSFLRYVFITALMLLPSFCDGMKSNRVYALDPEEQARLLYDTELTVLSNRIKQLFLEIEHVSSQLNGMLSLKSLYALHKESASDQNIDWYCSRFLHYGSDAIKNQGLLVYCGLILSRECKYVLVRIEELATVNPLLGVLYEIFKTSHAKLQSSIIKGYNHLDDYGKYSFACYFYETNLELFVGDCKATDEFIRLNIEFTAQAKRGLMDELNVSLSH